MREKRSTLPETKSQFAPETKRGPVGSDEFFFFGTRPSLPGANC